MRSRFPQGLPPLGRPDRIRLAGEPETEERRPTAMNPVRVLLAALLGVAAVAVVGPPAHACSCAEVGVPAHVRSADVVLLATVTRIEEPPLRRIMSSGDPRTYHLDVDTVFEGRAAGEVRSAMSGASCGLEGIVEGDRYLIFAEDRDQDGLWAGLCGGTSPVTPALVRRVVAVTGPGEPVGEGEPAEPVAGDTEPGHDLDPPAQPAVPLWLVAVPSLALAAALVALVAWRRRRAG